MLPDVLAMLFADDVHRDSVSGKYTVLGTYATLGVPFFPWTQDAVIVYLAFTDAEGKFSLRLRVIDAAQKAPPLIQQESILYLSQPRMVAERAFVLINLQFPEPGEYRVQLFSDGHLIRERSLKLMKASVNGRYRKN